MSADGAECDLLVLAINLIQEARVSECAVIGMVVLDGAISLRHHLLESLHCKNSLVDSEVTHEMDVDKITDVVTKGGATPNASACEEARHLRDETWLGRDYLVGRNSIAGEDMITPPTDGS